MDVEAILELVDYGNTEDACWWWRGKLSSAGYPVFVTKAGKHIPAQLLMAELAGLDLKECQLGGTRCGRRSCVNPAHLKIVAREL